jgi:hypothetical protein
VPWSACWWNPRALHGAGGNTGKAQQAGIPASTVRSWAEHLGLAEEDLAAQLYRNGLELFRIKDWTPRAPFPPAGSSWLPWPASRRPLPVGMPGMGPRSSATRRWSAPRPLSADRPRRTFPPPSRE